MAARPLSRQQWIRGAATAAAMVALGLVVIGTMMIGSGGRHGMMSGVATPMDAAMLRQRAEAARDRGRPAEAERLIRLGARLGWRDSQTQYWLLQDALQRGDHRDALERIDALLRRRPGQATRLFPVLHALAIDPDGRDAIVARLADAPPWRAAFFQDVAGIDDGMTQGHEALLDRLMAARALSPRDEILPYVRRLVAAGEYARAGALWVRAMGAPSSAQAPAGSFAEIDLLLAADRIAPFEWRVGRVAGAEILPEPAGVRIRMDGSTFGTLLERTISLAPGIYRIASRASDDWPLRNGQIGWAVSCLPARQRLPVIALPPRAGAVGWLFSIPSSGCVAQQLALQTRRVTQGGAVDLLLSDAGITPATRDQVEALQ
ncbi:hypothetical protein [Sphingobium aquiterrae]|uniref:hypothetical protein n=1 Tax=Sphingobium aquiterrae TaxID=2038656 RepID=UPI003018C87F